MECQLADRRRSLNGEVITPGRSRRLARGVAHSISCRGDLISFVAVGLFLFFEKAGRYSGFEGGVHPPWNLSRATPNRPCGAWCVAAGSDAPQPRTGGTGPSSARKSRSSPSPIPVGDLGISPPRFAASQPGSSADGDRCSPPQDAETGNYPYD